MAVMCRFRPLCVVLLLTNIYFIIIFICAQQQYKSIQRRNTYETTIDSVISPAAHTSGNINTRWPDDLIPMVGRAKEIQRKCLDNPPPLPPELRNEESAKNVSLKLSQFFRKSHWKKMSSSLISLPEHGIVWCAVPKVASTSIAKAFLTGGVKSSIPTNISPQVQLRAMQKLDEEKLPYMMAEFTSFFVVREPLERLVAAFRNKLQNITTNHDGLHFYNNYARNIISKYRKPKHLDKEESHFNEPTFQEFVDYLLDVDPHSYDEHWKPISIFCDVCHLKFKYILRYENFQKEISAFLDHLKRTNSIPKSFSLLWENRLMTDASVTKTYLSQLTTESLRNLVKIYQHDFELFGYDKSTYLH